MIWPALLHCLNLQSSSVSDPRFQLRFLSEIHSRWTKIWYEIHLWAESTYFSLLTISKQRGYMCSLLNSRLLPTSYLSRKLKNHSILFLHFSPLIFGILRLYRGDLLASWLGLSLLKYITNFKRKRINMRIGFKIRLLEFLNSFMFLFYDGRQQPLSSA